MRLELKSVNSSTATSASPSKWFFERGKRSLGRGPDCDWQLAQDQRSVSKLHCTIERDSRGFVLRDQSANGSRVDGITVHEGEIARLRDMSRLELGELAFSVHITGEIQQDIEDPEANLAISDETLTISAILSDISPGGRTATGILGDRASQEWIEPMAPGKNRSSPSRNVDIGWMGPPDVDASRKILPDDWDADTLGGDHSEYGSHLEHGSATHVAIPVNRTRTIETVETANGKSAVPPAQPDEFQSYAQGRTVELADRLDPLLHRLEETLEASFDVFGIAMPGLENEPDFFGRSREDVLLTRVESVLHRQATLGQALENLLHHASQAMEPRILEARIDAAAGPMSWARNRDYWRSYRAQFENNGRTLSVRDFFHDAMTGKESGTGTLPAGQKGNDDHEK